MIFTWNQHREISAYPTREPPAKNSTVQETLNTHTLFH